MLFVVYILTILTLLLIPTAGTIELSDHIFGIRTDHFIHTCLFLPFMGYIWIRNLHRESWKGFFTAYLVGVVFAAFCESLHLVVKYRSFDLHDFYANLTGLSMGCVVFLFRTPKY